MARPDRIIRGYLRTRLLITSKNGQTWDALVVDADDRTVTLANVESISPDGTRTSVAGEVFLPRADVAYMQRT